MRGGDPFLGLTELRGMDIAGELRAAAGGGVYLPAFNAVRPAENIATRPCQALANLSVQGCAYSDNLLATSQAMDLVCQASHIGPL